MDRYSRRELMRKARYLRKNGPLTKAIIERLVVYIVGTGIHPTPTTSDQRFNAAARLAWEQWCKQPDIHTRNSYSSIQRIRCRGILVDGDHFTVLTRGSSGRPRIQLIESHNITHGLVRFPYEVDGVTLVDGRPATYHYVPDLKLGTSEPILIDAANIVAHLMPERAQQHRGITILDAAINYAHDIEDIVALEKAAVKDAATRVDIIKTESGELDDETTIGRSLRKQFSDEDGDHGEAKRYYQEKFGPESIVLRNGDEHTPYVPQRPSPAWTGFMEFLEATTCLSTGLPPSVLLGTKVGGADSRRELASAQRVVEIWQQVLAEQDQRIYEYVIGSEIDAGYITNPPKDWRSVEWHCAPRLTVDAGRESREDREDVKAGLLTRREYFGRWGQDWREQMKQSAVEAAEIKRLAAEHGVTPEEIAQRYPNPGPQEQQEAGNA